MKKIEYFGKFSARADDILNVITSLFMIGLTYQQALIPMVGNRLLFHLMCGNGSLKRMMA